LGGVIDRALARLDPDEIRATHRRQDEFVHLPGCFPPELVERLIADVERVRPHVHRNYIPGHKKGGSVSYWTLVEEAPAILGLYRSPALLAFLERVTGQRLQPCPDSDPHACALYFYTEPGDHIGFHHDTSYYRGARYTVLLGLIERSSSRLVCQLYRGAADRELVELRLATQPGTLVLFNGDRLWHSVTPLGTGEERVSLTMEYVTDPSIHPLRRFVSNMKDAIAYFGLRTVFLGGRGRAGLRRASARAPSSPARRGGP
jgi:hypothetical protein